MNSLVTILNGTPVTTTLAIAEGTQVQHKNVLELLRTYLDDLKEFGSVAFETRPREAGKHGGGDVEYATLNEQQSTLLLTYMRNSDIVRGFKKRLVKAFWEMVNRPQIDPMQVLNDPAAMRGLLLGYTEKVIALEELVGALTPKAEGFDTIAGGDGLVNLMTGAKILQLPPRKFTDFLRENHWIYRRAGGRSNLAYQDKIQAGYMTHKVYIQTDDDGTEHVREQAMITPKGLAKLAELLQKETEPA